jgi:hypothetical protein
VVPENTDDDPEHHRDRDDPLPDALPVSGTEPGVIETDDSDEPDFSNLLRNFEDAADLDDQVASEVDTGIEVGETPDLPEDMDQPLLDVGETVEPPPEAKIVVAEGDEFGPRDDPAVSDAVESLPETVHGDDDEGVSGDDVETAELGALDSNAEDDEAAPAPPDDVIVSLEDDPPGPAALPWLDVDVASSPVRTVVASHRGKVISAGTDVSELDEAGVRKTLIQSVGSTVTSLLCTPDGSVFYTTREGELFRIDSRGSECIAGWIEALDLKQPAYALELGGMTPSSRPAMLLRVGSGRKELLESTDYGSTFRRVDLGGQILAVSSGSPPVCLVKGDRSIRVVRSESTGGFTSTGATLRGDAKNLVVVAHADVVAVLDPGRGVQVSADGGRSLRHVEGSARATAVAAGLVAGRPIVFAALFNPATETAKIALMDAASAEAVVVAGIDPDDNDDGDFSRVTSLAWNEYTETLWGAGAFGLRCWRRPPSA